jgi:hypothetical protein
MATKYVYSAAVADDFSTLFKREKKYLFKLCKPTKLQYSNKRQRICLRIYILKIDDAWRNG